MPTTLKDVIIIGRTYSVNPLHRNGHGEKSQWTISIKSEHKVFKNCCNSIYQADDRGWGVNIDCERITYIGHAAGASDRLLFIAKFVSNSENKWHGYPADHQRCGSTDIPPEAYLNTLMINSFLSPAKIRKILRGQPCNLSL